MRGARGAMLLFVNTPRASTRVMPSDPRLIGAVVTVLTDALVGGIEEVRDAGAAEDLRDAGAVPSLICRFPILECPWDDHHHHSKMTAAITTIQITESFPLLHDPKTSTRNSAMPHSQDSND